VKLIVGLGNPGRQYEGTRHNVGFAALDLLARRHGVEWESARTEALMGKWRAENTLLAKPLTFMNLSGRAVIDLLQFYKIEPQDLFVIVDEVQLEVGRLRARPSGSSGGHNGLKSIIGVLGTENFPRLRIGVGRGDTRRDLADHVLARFDAAERPIIDDAIGRAADAAETFIREEIVAVMNTYNRKDDKTSDSEDT
jgi:peptidyl-tRNA hydrolase, PTH1 family